MRKITLIPGDGIGPEISEAMKRCVGAVADIEWDVQNFKDTAGLLDSIKRNRVAVKGPITTPVGSGFRSINVALRSALDLYASVRPAKIYPGVKTPFTKVDIVVIRENLEDLYAGIEFEKGAEAKKFIAAVKKLTGQKIREDSGISVKSISTFNSRRIVEFAFRYAIANKRKKVTAVHKANIMKFSDGLFLGVARSVARRYRKIKFEERIVDNMCMQLVQKPQQYDVLVCPNLYGDIISDLCAGLVGGLGVAPSANIGEKYAVFETVHGSAPKYAGKNKANPAAMILASAMMLCHIGERKAADELEEAVAKVIKDGKHVTYDIARKRPSGTRQMADAIIRELKK